VKKGNEKYVYHLLCSNTTYLLLPIKIVKELCIGDDCSFSNGIKTIKTTTIIYIEE